MTLAVGVSSSRRSSTNRPCASARPQIVVVLNWFDELEDRVPTQ